MASRAIRILNKIEESPWTRNWQHLTPLRRQKPTRMSPAQAPTPVPVKDRIRQWNIIPGDRIRIRGDKESVIQEVLGINRYRNLVFLKARQVSFEAIFYFPSVY